MSLSQSLMLPPGYGFDGSAFTPASLPGIDTWFNPGARRYSAISPSLVPAVHDDPTEQWSCSYPLDGSRSIGAAVLANRPILEIGANGKSSFLNDGTNDTFTAADAAWNSLDSGSWAIYMDVKLDAVSGTQFVVAKDDAGSNREMAALIDSSGHLYMEIQGGFATSQTTDTVSAGAWAFLAMKYDSATQKTSVNINNGTAVVSGGTRDIPASAADLTFMSRSGGALAAGSLGHIVCVRATLPTTEEEALLYSFFQSERPT
jgi:hypothetical protein